MQIRESKTMIITSLQNKFWFIYLYKLTYTDIATLDLDTTEIGLTRSSICFGGGPARKTRDGRLSSGAQVLHTKLLEATNLCLLVRCSPMFSSLNCQPAVLKTFWFWFLWPRIQKLKNLPDAESGYIVCVRYVSGTRLVDSDTRVKVLTKMLNEGSKALSILTIRNG